MFEKKSDCDKLERIQNHKTFGANTSEVGK